MYQSNQNHYTLEEASLEPQTYQGTLPSTFLKRNLSPRKNDLPI